MGPILLGAPLPSQRCMRDLGTDSIPTGYKLMRRVSHTVSLGLRLGSKTNLRRVVRLDKQAESPAGAHSWHGHYGSARAFAVNPARLKARPLRARGLTAPARPSKGALHAKNGTMRLAGEVATPRSVRLARPGLRKRLTPRPSYKRQSRRVPHPSMVTFRAICRIHGSSG